MSTSNIFCILQNGSKNTKVKITKRQPHQFSQWFQEGEEQGKGWVQWGGKSKCVIRVSKIQGPDWPDNEGKFFIQLALIGPVFIRFWSRPCSSIGRVSNLPQASPAHKADLRDASGSACLKGNKRLSTPKKKKQTEKKEKKRKTKTKIKTEKHEKKNSK